MGNGAETLGLNLADTDDTLTDFRTGLSWLQLAQVADGDVGNFDLYVDTAGNYRARFSFVNYSHVMFICYRMVVYQLRVTYLRFLKVVYTSHIFWKRGSWFNTNRIYFQGCIVHT